jgi:hypothetical protein
MDGLRLDTKRRQSAERGKHQSTYRHGLALPALIFYRPLTEAISVGILDDSNLLWFLKLSGNYLAIKRGIIY